MSWSTTYRDLSADDAWDLEVPENANTEQFEAATTAVGEIIDSGVVGDPSKHRFNVNISGHANPDHEPCDEWANDCVSIHISQV